MLKRIQKIQKMESILDECSECVENLNLELERFLTLQSEYKKLVKYYHSKQFYKDVEDYEGGVLNKEIKCGVLSQDSIYNLIGENFEVAKQMQRISKKILKEHENL